MEKKSYDLNFQSFEDFGIPRGAPGLKEDEEALRGRAAGGGTRRCAGAHGWPRPCAPSHAGRPSEHTGLLREGTGGWSHGEQGLLQGVGMLCSWIPRPTAPARPFGDLPCAQWVPPPHMHPSFSSRLWVLPTSQRFQERVQLQAPPPARPTGSVVHTTAWLLPEKGTGQTNPRLHESASHAGDICIIYRNDLKPRSIQKRARDQHHFSSADVY